LHRSGYVKPGNDAVSEKKLRRLVLRLSLDAMDAKVLLGMARQIVWKLRQTFSCEDAKPSRASRRPKTDD